MANPNPTVLNVMAARRVNYPDQIKQQPYEYTPIVDYEQLVLHVRTLFASASDSRLIFRTGMYRREDCMETIAEMAIATAQDNSIQKAILGRDAVDGSEKPLGAWLSVECQANAAEDRCVVEVKAVAR